MVDMTAGDVIKEIVKRGGTVLRQKGSHVRVKCACGVNFTTVPDHGHQDLKPGTLRAIERALEPCANFGKGWLR